MVVPKAERSLLLWIAALLACSVVGCRSVVDIVLDLPERPSSGLVVAGSAGDSAAPGFADGTIRPPIESTRDPASALALLPLDPSGRVDWMEALRTGAIRPRGSLPGVPEPPLGFRPEFEVLFQGPDSTADAIFPHAPHVEWLACEQCHSPVQLTPIVTGYSMVTMTDVLQGELCGQCHGKVSFSPTGQIESCQRCHPRLVPEVDPPRAASPGPEVSTVMTGRDASGETADGSTIYLTWCAMCHGETGLGDGVLGGALLPRPRDFTEALYQLRTTPSGDLPTDADLRRVIDEGIPGTAMPGWKHKLTEAERDALVAFLKTLSDYFDIPPGDPVDVVKPELPPTADDLAAGRALFDEMQCFKCHGPEGRGDGPSAATLTDDWGMPIEPADLTRGWRFNGGPEVEDIYTRLRTGLDGTPMPSLGDVVDAGVVSEAQLWQLAQYIRSLSVGRTAFGDIGIRMRRVALDREADSDAGQGFVTEDLAPALFPHWVHRIRFRCKACHTQLFEPRAGANEITMVDIGRGEFCGKCHDGVTAFAAGFGACRRCHVPVFPVPSPDSVKTESELPKGSHTPLGSGGAGTSFLSRPSNH